MKKVFLVLFFAFSVSATPIGALSLDATTIKKCEAKASIMNYVLMYRDQETLPKMLAKWEKEWETAKHETFNKHKTYIDAQRIIRDAHRKRTDGTYVMTNTQEKIDQYVKKTFFDCAHNKF